MRPGQRWTARGLAPAASPGLQHLGLALLALVGGCGLSTREAGGTAEALKKPELACTRAGADRVEASSFRPAGQSPSSGAGNSASSSAGSGASSGKNDIVKVFTRSPEVGGGVVLACKELDLNGDGRKDMLVYYDSHGRKLREEFDHDFDGLADMKSYYELGQLVRQELDVDFDGKPDLVEYFENGKRVRLEKFLALPPAVAAPSAPDSPSSTSPSAAPGISPSAAPSSSPGTAPSSSPGFSPGAAPSSSPGFSPGAAPSSSPGTAPSISPGSPPPPAGER